MFGIVKMLTDCTKYFCNYCNYSGTNDSANNVNPDQTSPDQGLPGSAKIINVDVLFLYVQQWSCGHGQPGRAISEQA